MAFEFLKFYKFVINRCIFVNLLSQSASCPLLSASGCTCCTQIAIVVLKLGFSARTRSQSRLLCPGSLSHYTISIYAFKILQWRHNERDGVSNHQPHEYLLHRLFRRRWKTSTLRVTGLCVGNSPVTGEFRTQMASNAENVSIWWRHHEIVPISTHSQQHLINT